MSEFQSTRLENGLEIIGEPVAGVQSAAVAIFVRHGAVDDDRAEAGLAHLTESAMFRGTENRSSREISEQLDRIGARHSSSTGLEATLFSSIMLGNHLEETLEILVDVIRHAAFPPEELEAVRALQLQEIGQRNDQPAQLVMDLGRRQYFGDHPFGNDSLGSLDSVAGVTRERVMQTWSHHFRPESTLIAFAGNFSWPAMVEAVDRFAGMWSGPGQADGVVGAASGRSRWSVVDSPGSQENLCFTFPGVPYGDPDYYAASLASTVLGSGMNSRLFTEVREKRGLAYSVGSRLDPMSSAGLGRVYVGTQPERARESVEVIQSELDQLELHGVTEAELRLAKTRLKSRVVMGSESTGNRVMTIARDWFYQRRYRSLEEVREQIDAVTVEQIQQFLKRIRLTENLGLVCLGPLSADDLGIAARVNDAEVVAS